MARVRSIRFRVSKIEYERILNNMTARGFPTVSGYLRSLALERDQWIESKIYEIHETVLETRQIVGDGAKKSRIIQDTKK